MVAARVTPTASGHRSLPGLQVTQPRTHMAQTASAATSSPPSLPCLSFPPPCCCFLCSQQPPV